MDTIWQFVNWPYCLTVTLLMYVLKYQAKLEFKVPYVWVTLIAGAVIGLIWVLGFEASPEKILVSYLFITSFYGLIIKNIIKVVHK